jgi:predicted nucleic acid-binding protein
MYLDSAYIAKFYVNEPDADRVRALIRRADSLASSAWCLAEVACVLHRHLLEGSLSVMQARALAGAFREHVDSGFWNLAPVSDRLLRRVNLMVGGLPRDVYIRARDAVHLITALDLDEAEIWTNDRHLLAAAPHFGLKARSV